MQVSVPEILPIWGAVLSTLLALLKIWEVWKDRVRLSTSYSFSSVPDQGNEIIIQNPSNTPVMVTYWTLDWVKGPWWRRKSYMEADPEDGHYNITIAAHSRHSLHFRDEDHFEWGRKAKDNGVLYLHLHLVGRAKPIALKVYDATKWNK